MGFWGRLFGKAETGSNGLPHDSAEALVSVARMYKLLPDGELGFIPELQSIFSRSTEYFHGVVVRGMETAEGCRDPQAGLAVMQRVCMYLFAKGVEAVMLWSQSPSGQISIGIDAKNLTDLEIQTDLPPKYHRIAVDSMKWGNLMFEAHHQFLVQRLRQMAQPDEQYVRDEIRLTIDWVTRIAVNYAIAKGYHAIRW